MKSKVKTEVQNVLLESTVAKNMFLLNYIKLSECH